MSLRRGLEEHAGHENVHLSPNPNSVPSLQKAGLTIKFPAITSSWKKVVSASLLFESKSKRGNFHQNVLRKHVYFLPRIVLALLGIYCSENSCCFKQSLITGMWSSIAMQRSHQNRNMPRVRDTRKAASCKTSALSMASHPES